MVQIKNGYASPKSGSGSPKKRTEEDHVLKLPIQIDEKDPNYDSEDENAGDYILQELPPSPQAKKPQPPSRTRVSSFGHDADLSTDLPLHWTLEQFQKQVKAVMMEYFVSLELKETIRTLKELLSDCPTPDELVVIVVRMALDDNKRQTLVRDVLYNLSSACNLRDGGAAGALDHAAFIRGFEKLVCTWGDLAIDAPNAPDVLVGFIYGAVVAGFLHQSFLSRLPEDLLNVALKNAEPETIYGSELQAVLGGVVEGLHSFKKTVCRSLEEYFTALNTSEVEIYLQELDKPEFHHEVVKKVTSLSFTGSDPMIRRDQALTLLVHLSETDVLTKDDLQWGVTRILGQLDDLSLDCPKVNALATDFCSGLLMDELVSISFLRRCRFLRVGGASGVEVLDAAQKKTPEYSKKMLGPAQFKREIHGMIQEYFESGDCEEVGRLVRELSPLTATQCAEIVRKLMTFAMERSGKDCEAALELLIWMQRQEELTSLHVEQGFDDLYSKMDDLLLDVPDAREMAKSFVVETKKAGILRSDWKAPMF